MHIFRSTPCVHLYADYLCIKTNKQPTKFVFDKDKNEGKNRYK